MAGTRPDPQAPYLRVAAAFRARIADGSWPAGHRLASRGDLGQEFAVGDNVVRRAQELLISEGLLEGRAGSGTYVRASQPRRRLSRTGEHLLADSPFRSEMAALGMNGTWEYNTIAKAPAPVGIAERLAIAPDDPCVRTDYEFLADRRPAMLSTSWEPMAVTGGTVIVLPEGGPLAGSGVVARMAAIGITVTRAVEIPRPVMADREQAQCLGVSAGTPALLIERTFYDTDGRPVETADILVSAQRWDTAYAYAIPPRTP